MGFVSDVAGRVREYFRRDKERLAVQMAKGATSAGYPTSGYDLLQAYGYDVLSDYLKLETDLLARYVDYEEMDDYPEISAAVDIVADDASQPDSMLNRTVWVESPDDNIKTILDDLFHKTLRMDEEIWEIARTLCIAEGQLVWTSKGPKPIENVEPGEWVQAYKDGKLLLVRVKARYDNGIRNVVKIQTRHREVVCTPDHLMLTQESDGTTRWVPAKDLIAGRHPGGGVDRHNTSKLVISTRAPEPPEVPSWEALGFNPQAHNQRGTPADLVLPPKMEPWICRLLGFMWGDGFMGSVDLDSTSTATFLSRGVYPELNDKYDGFLTKLGLNPMVEEAHSRTAVHSIRFKEFLTDLGWKNGASNKRLPLWVGMLPWEFRKEFLDGFIDADGWTTQQSTWTRPAIHFEIANVPLAYDLKALIDGLGFRSGQVRTRKRKPGFKIKGKVVKTPKVMGAVVYSEFKYPEAVRTENVLHYETQDFRRVYDLEVEDACSNFVNSGVITHNCKYGNDFEEILLTNEGVKGLNFLPPPTVRRIEGPRGELFGFVQDFKGKFGYTAQEFQQILAARTAMVRGGAEKAGYGGLDKISAMEDWEVTHFRLRGKHRRSIYGYAILEPARWIWKRLMLLEDASLIYRLQRAPERYAFYVDVGDLPPAEALAYVNRVRQGHKKTKYYNPSTGKLDLKFNPMSQDEDFFIPTRKGQDGARIEVLGAPSWQHMDDIEYFRDKLFAALKVPKAYMGQEEGVARAILSSEDVRFARSVLRVQREIRNGLSKVCRVHLAALGIDPYSVDYDIKMTVPSAIFELAQIEVRTARADLASRMQGFVSIHWLLSNVFGMSDSDIERILIQRGEDQEREQIQQQSGMAKAMLVSQKINPAMGAVPGMPGAPGQAPPPGGDPNQPMGAAGPSDTGLAPPQQSQILTPNGIPGVMSPEDAKASFERVRQAMGRANNGSRMTRRGAMTEQELFQHDSPENNRRNSAMLEKLLKNDKQLANRLREVQELLGDLRSVASKR